MSLVDNQTTVKYELLPLKLGVEVVGVDIVKAVGNAELMQQLKTEAHQHRLLVFKNQGQLSASVFISFCQHLGEVFNEPYTTQTKTLENHPKSPAPAIMRISNDPNEGFKGVGISGWHIDGAYKDLPYLFLVFNSIKTSRGGNTKFVGFREVFDSIDREKLSKWDKIWLVNTRTVLGEKVVVTQPLVHNHPIVREPAFCAHFGYVEGAIDGYGTPNQRQLNEQEVAHLKAEVTAEIVKDNERLVYSHEWHEGDVVVIDNLQLAHLASEETQKSVEEVGLRVLHRIAINGVDKPSK